MLKNFWLCIPLLLMLSPISWAAEDTEEMDEDIDAVYRADQTPVFNQEEEEINDRGLIRDTEDNPLQYVPKTQSGLKAKGSNCVPNGPTGEECEDIEITN